jgi:hypothetical protein
MFKSVYGTCTGKKIELYLQMLGSQLVSALLLLCAGEKSAIVTSSNLSQFFFTILPPTPPPPGSPASRENLPFPEVRIRMPICLGAPLDYHLNDLLTVLVWRSTLPRSTSNIS